MGALVEWDRSSFLALAEVGSLAVALDGGQRGAASVAGEPGLAVFELAPARALWPACSKHGAMNRLSGGRRVFRCLAEGCNVGLEWTP